MRNFTKGNRFSDRKNTGNFDRHGSKGRDFSRRDAGAFGRPQMHKAICDDCGQSCEVPFKPTGDKPVYCSNCFKGKDNAGPSRSFGRDNFREKKMFSAICDACGQSCEVPFRPTGDKPVYCSNCFGQDSRAKDRKPAGDGANKQFEHQLQTINEKLDKILQNLSSTMPKSPELIKKKVITKAESKPKAVKVKKTKKAVKK